MSFQSKIVHVFAITVLMFLFKTFESNDSCRGPASIQSGCMQQIEKISNSNFGQKLKVAGKAIYDYSLWFTGKPFVFHIRGDVKYKRLQSAYYDFAIPIIKALSPIKTFTYDPNYQFKIKPETFLYRGPAQKIFDRLWQNPDMILTGQEIMTLSTYKLIKQFRRTQQRIKAHPYQHRAALYGEQIFFWSKFMSFFAGAVYMYEQSKTGIPNIVEFIEDEKYKLDKYQVQILVDSVPFPHLGIRMGDVVYSYGQTHMTRREMVTYFDSKAYTEMLRELYPDSFNNPELPEDAGSMDIASFHVNKSMSKFADFTGLSSMTKTLTAITLKLTKEEFVNLKIHFESHRGHRYKNFTMINDCATMLTRALKQHTTFEFNRIIDASPGQVGIALSIMKSQGDDRVGPIYQVSMANEGEEDPSDLLLRNTYIHMMESKLFISWFLYNQGMRAFVDLIYDEEQLVYLEKAVEEHWQTKWQQEMEQYFMQDPRLSFLDDLITIAEFYYYEDPIQFRKQMNNISAISQVEFDKMFEQSQISRMTDFYDKKKYAHRNKSILDYCIEFKNKVENKFPDLENFDLNCRN